MKSNYQSKGICVVAFLFDVAKIRYNNIWHYKFYFIVGQKSFN